MQKRVVEGSPKGKSRSYFQKLGMDGCWAGKPYKALAGLKHQIRILNFPASICLSLFLRLSISSGHPSLWPLARSHCCSHLGRSIDCLSEPFRALTLVFHFTWCVGAFWTPTSTLTLPPLPISLCLWATVLLFSFLQEMSCLIFVDSHLTMAC